jgi:hypothetical protein
VKQISLLFAVGLLIALAAPVPAFGSQEKPHQSASPTAEVIRMKVGNAVEAARFLDEAFNGTGLERKARVVVFVIPLTDCLFVEAMKDDLATIRSLLRSL